MSRDRSWRSTQQNRLLKKHQQINFTWCELPSPSCNPLLGSFRIMKMLRIFVTFCLQGSGPTLYKSSNLSSFSGDATLTYAEELLEFSFSWWCLDTIWLQLPNESFCCPSEWFVGAKLAEKQTSCRVYKCVYIYSLFYATWTWCSFK